MKIRTKRGARIFTAVALIGSALLTAGLLFMLNRPTPRPPVPLTVPETSPEQREVACLDRLLKSEIPKGTDVDRLVAACRGGAPAR